MRCMRGIGLAASLLPLLSCANPAGDLAVAAPQLMLGMPKTELMACAGVPKETIAFPGEERLTFERQQTIVTYEPDEPIPVPGFPHYPSFWPHSFKREQILACRANVTVRDGRISKLEYAPDRNLNLCYDLFANCLPPLPSK